MTRWPGRIWHGLAGMLLWVQAPVCVLAYETPPPNALAAAVSAADWVLDLPIDCTLGVDCNILAYVDVAGDQTFRDLGGGRQTYDAHDGTDFGIADEAAMRRGVAVKAAAAGTVVWVRDGMADQRVEDTPQAEAVKGTGCGNAVVIDHPNHWRTYYCHLRRGSLLVTPGMRVEQGAALGLVGLSGLTSYPHVHFGLHHRGRTVDPFSGLPLTLTDSKQGRSLWKTPVAYVACGLINAGFGSTVPHIRSVWQGRAEVQSLSAGAAAISFWVHPFGVLGGDVEQLRLIDPKGNRVAALDRVIASPNRINWLSSVLKRNAPGETFDTGVWQGEYQLRRGDKVLIDIRRAIEVTQP